MTSTNSTPVSKTISPSLANVYQAFRTYLRIDDLYILIALLAARVAHEFDGSEAIAALIVGPSSSAKTEIVVAIGKAPRAYLLSDLSPQTLLSGWRTSAGNQSLLLRLRNHVLSIKDLTTIISGRPDVRAKVFGQLREILDGSYEQTWGNGERVTWSGKLSVIGACTPVIDEHHDVMAQLGTRWLYVRTSITDPRALARAAISRGGTSKVARAHAAQVVADYIDQFRPMALSLIALSDHHEDALARLAMFLAVARAPVVRDRYHRHITEAPVIEGPSRAAKQLHMIAAAHARMHDRMVIADDDITLVSRIAWDSIPHLRGRVLRTIVDEPGIGVSRIAAGINSRMDTTIRRVVEDLSVLGLIDHASGGYTISPDHDLAQPVRAPSPELGPAVTQLTTTKRRGAQVARICGSCGSEIAKGDVIHVDFETGLAECADCGAPEAKS